MTGLILSSLMWYGSITSSVNLVFAQKAWEQIPDRISFELGTTALLVRRMPAFFETFPGMLPSISK